MNTDAFDPENLRIQPGDYAAGKLGLPTRPPRHRQGEPFIKGPLPYLWMKEAMKLPGKAVTVALVLWQAAGCCNRATVSFNQSAMTEFNIHPDTAKRGLRTLEEAGLVHIARPTGKKLAVTLLPLRPELP